MIDPAAARLLAKNRLERQRLSALSPGLRPLNEAAAYAIQAQLHHELAPKLGKIAGHKIGCTTAVMQHFLNIPNPCAGGVFANTIYQSGATISHRNFVRPGVECEIVVFLKNDLPPLAQPYTKNSVASAVGAIAAGIEIVDDRYVDYKNLDTPTLIADDFFDAGCVIGSPVSDWKNIDIPTLVGRTLINDVEVGRGQASDVMGHPFAALVWLANSLIARGEFLKRDEFVFTGSVVETRWVSPDETITVLLDHLGEVQINFKSD